MAQTMAMLKLYISSCCTVTFLLIRPSNLCCVHAVLMARFRFRNHLVMVRTRSCFGLKHLFWSSQTLEMSQSLFKKQLFFVALNPAEKCLEVFLQTSIGVILDSHKPTLAVVCRIIVNNILLWRPGWNLPDYITS